MQTSGPNWSSPELNNFETLSEVKAEKTGWLRVAAARLGLRQDLSPGRSFTPVAETLESKRLTIGR